MKDPHILTELGNFGAQMAEISWLMFTNCHDRCHCVYTEVTERESSKVCHVFKSGSDLKMHI